MPVTDADINLELRLIALHSLLEKGVISRLEYDDAVAAALFHDKPSSPPVEEQ